MRSGNPMASVLTQAISRMESAGQIRESLALAYWPRVAGPQAAAATEVESVRDGVLFVRTKSSVWSHELTLHKARLLTGLNRMLGGKVIQEIIFRARGVTKTEAPVEPDTPSVEELAAVVLERTEKAELRARLQELISVEDDHARKTIATRLVLDAKLRHWRLERGWHVCHRCSAVHKTDFRLCPICRLCR
jgi:predicted nucleic acid-binding Zn ribbon protein